MAHYRSVCIDLKMPAHMVVPELGALEDSVPSIRRPDNSTEIFVFTGDGVDATPYLNGVRSCFKFVGITPIWVESENYFILRFLFGQNSIEAPKDPLTLVRREMYIQWLGYYMERYSPKSVHAYETPYNGDGKTLTVTFDDLVLVVDDNGNHLVSSNGSPLHYEGFLSYTRDVPEFVPRHRTGV